MRTKLASALTAAVGVLVLRVVVTGEASTFVTGPITVLLGIAGVVLVGLGLWTLLARPAAEHAHDHEHPGPIGLWAVLALPVLLLGIVAPRPLGSYVVAHSSTRPPSAPSVQKVNFPPLVGDPAELTLEDYWRRSTSDAQATLQGHTLVLTGFVSDAPQPDGSWTVARLKIWCCAADALPFQATVHGVAAPAEGQWVRVTGTALPADADRNAQFQATAVEPIAQPDDPYLR